MSMRSIRPKLASMNGSHMRSSTAAMFIMNPSDATSLVLTWMALRLWLTFIV